MKILINTDPELDTVLNIDGDLNPVFQNASVPCGGGSASTKQQLNISIDYYNAATGIYDGSTSTLRDEEPKELLHRGGPRIMLEHFRPLLPVVGDQSRLTVEEICHIRKFAADLDKHA
jgi:hypothetical protein